MPKLFPGAAARRNNIIVRFLSKTIHFVQLDDLDAGGLGRVGEAAFLTLETSPGTRHRLPSRDSLPRRMLKIWHAGSGKGQGPTIRPRALPRGRHHQLQAQIRTRFSDRADRLDCPRTHRMLIAASGSSRHAGLVGEMLLEDFAGLPVDVEYSSEYICKTLTCMARVGPRTPLTRKFLQSQN